MKLGDIKRLLPYMFKAQVVPFLWGTHGIGKSDAIKQYAAENNLTLVDLRLGQLEVGDLLGMPEIKDGEKGRITEYATPKWLEVAKKGDCIIFWDELNRARPDVLQAIFQAVLDRKYYGTDFAPTTYQVVAANPNSSEYFVTELDAALMNRFCHIKVTPNADEWIDYAEGSKHNDAIVDFIKQYHNMLGIETPVFNLDIKPRPRAWSMLSRIMANKPPEELLFEVVVGLLGTAAGASFIESINEFEKPVHAVDIFDNWTSVKDRVKKLASPKKSRVDLLKIASDEIIKIVRNFEKGKGGNKAKLSTTQERNVIEFIKMVPKELAFAIMKELGQVGDWLVKFTAEAELVKMMQGVNIEKEE